MKTCPVCDSNKISTSHRFSVNPREAAQHFVLAEADPESHRMLSEHITALWGGATCEMLECEVCGFSFASPYVAGDGIFYNLAYPHCDYPQDKWEFTQTVSALKTLNIEGKLGIEIGSGFGYFLDKISPRFFPSGSITAVEYSDAARGKLSDKGFLVAGTDIRTDPFLEKKSNYDFVFMFQVLEHMDRLDLLSERIRDLTSANAHIFVAVPNPHRTRFNERNNSLLDMPPNHIGLWTKKSFEYFGRKLGCDLVDFKVEPISWIGLIKQDIIYSHLRRSQCGGSLANRVRAKSRTKMRRIVEAGVALAAAPSRIPLWLRAAKSSENLGSSIWVHFAKS